MKRNVALVITSMTLIVLAWSLIAVADSKKPKVELRCGAYCLYVGLKSLDIPVGDYKAFESKIGQPTAKGYSLSQLAEGANGFGAHTLGVVTSLEEIKQRSGRFACIAYLENTKHFVCIYNIDDKKVYVIDPPSKSIFSRDAFEGIWGGKALLISEQPLTLSRHWRYVNKEVVLSCVAGCFILGGVGLLILKTRGGKS